MTNNNIKIPETPLFNAMDKLYVDESGATIAEAVQLAYLILQLISDIHESISKITDHPDKNMFGYMEDFYTSLVFESFSAETYRHNKDSIMAQIETLKSVDKEAGIFTKDVVNGSFSDILDNEFFSDASCNVILRVLIIEAVTRTFNTHYNTIYPLSKEHESAQNVFYTYSNMHCSFHSLSMIAFLCNGQQDHYKAMDRVVEKYAHERCRELGHVLIQSAAKY